MEVIFVVADNIRFKLRLFGFRLVTGSGPVRTINGTRSRSNSQRQPMGPRLGSGS
ncbi:hypothetical protein Hanom_Chr02g00124451 [Helianthus anomalus]